MNIKELIIIGSGGHSRVVASTAQCLGYSVTAMFSDSPKLGESSMSNIPVRDIADLKSDGEVNAIIAIGSNITRKKISNEYNFNWVTLRHPFSWVHDESLIGEGTIICAGSIVQPRAKIGKHVIINTKSSVDHDTIVGDFCHVSVAHLAGGASMGEGSLLGLHSVTLPSINIGPWSQLGAGAVAIKDVPEHSIAVGIPARVI